MPGEIKMEAEIKARVEKVSTHELSKIVTIGWYLALGDKSYKFLEDNIRVPGDADNDAIKRAIEERRKMAAENAPAWPDVSLNEDLVGQEI